MITKQQINVACLFLLMKRLLTISGEQGNTQVLIWRKENIAFDKCKNKHLRNKITINTRSRNASSNKV